MNRHHKPQPPVALYALSVIVSLLVAATTAAAWSYLDSPSVVVQETQVSAPAVTPAAPVVAVPAVVAPKPTAAESHSKAHKASQHVMRKPVVKHHATKKHHKAAKHHHKHGKKHHHKHRHHKRCR